MAATSKTVNPHRFPALCAFFRQQELMQCGPKEVAKLRSGAWKKINIKYDDWVAPYYIENVVRRKAEQKKPFCTFHNHTAGYGCNKEDCAFEHRCLVCQSSEHGAFFRTKTGVHRCLSVRAQYREEAVIEKEGITEDELYEAWKESDRKVIFKSQVGTVKYVYEKSHLTVTGFPRKADLHVYKAPAAVIKTQMRSPEIKNGGLIVLPAEEKKNAIVFVLYF